MVDESQGKCAEVLEVLLTAACWCENERLFFCSHPPALQPRPCLSALVINSSYETAASPGSFKNKLN